MGEIANRKPTKEIIVLKIYIMIIGEASLFFKMLSSVGSVVR